uniref:Uncharacterized protein n=1 Tax=Branchiostoma floridae TaxID=7739 RepID=C3Z5Y2_BRAFL|eukprot:XP_002596233.1 hypothetical protein BRAFLDRAFT_117989 [Branchiostoma floridae]
MKRKNHKPSQLLLQKRRQESREKRKVLQRVVPLQKVRKNLQSLLSPKLAPNHQPRNKLHKKAQTAQIQTQALTTKLQKSLYQLQNLPLKHQRLRKRVHLKILTHHLKKKKPPRLQNHHLLKRLQHKSKRRKVPLVTQAQKVKKKRRLEKLFRRQQHPSRRSRHQAPKKVAQKVKVKKSPKSRR